MVCFKCRLNRVQICRTQKDGGVVIRTRICRACFHKYKTIEKPTLIPTGDDIITNFNKSIEKLAV